MTVIAEYIELFPPDVREILENIRRTIKKLAPEAEEVISYRMPGFRLMAGSLCGLPLSNST